jgi:mono/diheme cytochrome c family protein
MPIRPLRRALFVAVPFALAAALGTAADDEPMQAMPDPPPPPGDRVLSDEEVAFFESKIRPLLVSHCYGCHSDRAEKVKGGLRLDTRDATLAGGESGPVLVPGDVEGSLLIRAVRYADPDYEMPPKGKLSAEAIADLERWVAMGAPDPRGSKPGTIDSAGPDLYGRTIDIAEGKRFWSFQAPAKPPIPAVKDPEWPLGDVDRLVLAAMEAKGLAPEGDAQRRDWLRRVTFDLTGLPPTVAEIAAFESDRSAAAEATVVDRLLASPAFGERWGRHWLDVARYAESSGKENNVLYPHAWRYRDYVIASFNADRPLDEFLTEQIAGDLLPSTDADDRARKLVATGFLAVGTKSHNAQNPRQFAFDLADEQLDAVTQGMLGLTVSCARCHDHKFDPIPQRDYYAMAGIFLSTATAYGTERGPGNRRPADIVVLPDGASAPDGPVMPAARRGLIAQAAENLRRQAETAKERAESSGDRQALIRARQQAEVAAVANTILERFDADGNPTKANRLAMGAVESDRLIDAPILTRGEVDQAGERVPRGFPQVLAHDSTPSIAGGSGRRELAAFIADESNPLTARVWANRVWLHLFGRGIVSTADNFGASGEQPSNQALLDYLAVRLVELDWSTKSLIRELVLSRTYRLASSHDSAKAQIDPEAIFLWRFPNKRLEAEAIRDAMLAAAGTLDLTPPIGSPVNFGEGSPRADGRPIMTFEWSDPQRHRSVYLPVVRDRIPLALEVFDFPEPAYVVGDRNETNVATQALYLMNDPNVIAAADAFADRLLAIDGKDADRIKAGFEIALGRPATSAEIVASREFLRDFAKSFPAATAKPTAETDRRPGQRLRERAAQRLSGSAQAAPTAPSETKAAWSALCQAIFQSAEFRTLD